MLLHNVRHFRGAATHPSLFSPPRHSIVAALLFALVGLTSSAAAKGVYQEPTDFISNAFGGTPPAPRVLWLTKDLQPLVQSILGHPYGALRVRYWERDARTAWVLEEIGKEQPITLGVVIDQNRIEQIRVLIFRESRGNEVRHAFFTDQFIGARLTPEGQLDRPIDGITGATLSTRALIKVARVALVLHQHRSGAAHGPSP